MIVRGPSISKLRPIWLAVFINNSSTVIRYIEEDGGVILTDFFSIAEIQKVNAGRWCHPLYPYNSRGCMQVTTMLPSCTVHLISQIIILGTSATNAPCLESLPVSPVYLAAVWNSLLSGNFGHWSRRKSTRLSLQRFHMAVDLYGSKGKI